MLPSELRLDEFVQFLADHAYDVVGSSGPSFFHHPLAEWLAVSCGCLVQVDSDGYSRVSSHCFFPLPRWARLLVLWTERCTPAPLTGEMVFFALAQIEAGLRLRCF